MDTDPTVSGGGDLSPPPHSRKVIVKKTKYLKKI